VIIMEVRTGCISCLAPPFTANLQAICNKDDVAGS
jgi:hypothetical protein